MERHRRGLAVHAPVGGDRESGEEATIDPVRRAMLTALLAAIAVGGIMLAPRAAWLVATLETTTVRAEPLARGGPRVDREPYRADVRVDILETPEPSPPATPAPTPEPTPEPTAEPTALRTVTPTVAAPAATRVPTPRPATPRPAPALSQAVGSLAEAELATLSLMNASRAQGGLRPYALDAGVSAVARAHSVAEAAVGYVYHDGPDGTALSRNRPACGTGWWSENTGKVWNNDVAALHREFMAEPWAPINHRTNIMDPSFTRVGIGAAQGRDAIYLTVVFCR